MLFVLYILGIFSSFKFVINGYIIMRKIVYKIKAHLSARRRERVFRMYVEYLKTIGQSYEPYYIAKDVEHIIKYLDSGNGTSSFA